MKASETARFLLTEFLAARDAGDTPDPEAFAGRLPTESARTRFRALLHEADGVRAALPDPRHPSRIGRFAIDGELGRGGMGVVFDGHTVRGNRVAVKVLPEERSLDEAASARFRRELETLAELRHPNVARVLEIGEDEGRLYLAMEALDGGSLEERIAAQRGGDRPVDDGDLRESVRVAACIGRALDAAHSRGVVHRDVKPSNILFDSRGEPRLVDFGLAFLENSSKLTTADHVLGTPAYLAPERLLDPTAADDRRVDVYSLGVTLYEAITGHRPFPASLPEAVASARLGPPDPALFLGREVDRPLLAIVERALQDRPSRRYATAGAFADDLEAWLEGRPVRALSGHRRRRLLALARRHPKVTGAILLAALLLVAGTVATVARRVQDARAAAAHLGTANEALASYDRTAAERRAQLTPPAGTSRNDWPRLGLAHRESPRADAARADRSALRREVELHFARGAEALDAAAALGEPSARHRLRELRARHAALLELEGRRDEAAATWAAASPDAPPPATLTIEPPTTPATVAILRYDRGAGTDVWPLTEARPPRPADDRLVVRLAAGSYVAVFRRLDGLRDVRFPLLLRSGEGETIPALELPSDEEIGDGWEYVPPGPFVAGGDPRAEAGEPRTFRHVDAFFVMRREVTMAEWLEFLLDLRSRGVVCLEPERAARFLSAGWPKDVPLHVPRENVHVPPGHALDDFAAGRVAYFEPDRALHQISHTDAVHYVRWRNERAAAAGEPWTYALPTGDQWEKAARGADGRAFAWGDVFDWRLCHGGH
ncbi:MAG: bifunctional serine/threonine-protein kinase/formylglycine-generating enzyme family protein, partial [Planctomycetota bacterium JB042]